MKLANEISINLIKPMIGKIYNDVKVNNRDDELIFKDENNHGIRFFHEQDCCESVVIDDVEGDLNDLIGLTILVAEEVSHASEWEGDESGTWTFYKFATAKGSVTVKWLGTSNGCYSESVYWKSF